MSCLLSYSIIVTESANTDYFTNGFETDYQEDVREKINFEFHPPKGNGYRKPGIGTTMREAVYSMNPYEKCPIAETESFTIRLIEQSDSEDLYQCYHDASAVALMNDDNCDFGFYAESEEKMVETIGYWIDFYKKGFFIRFSIVDHKSGTAVGTMEGFGGETGVLRVDLASTYETAFNIRQILNFARQNFKAYFGNDTLVTKAIPGAIERRKALEESGWQFIGKFREYADYYQITLN